MTEQETKKAKEARNAYMREYRARNPEKTREINARYWAKRAARERVSKDAEDAYAE